AMDDIVKAALKKWPTVPHCYGWLALDARGQWFMRDDRIQRAGPFPQVKGSVIRHDKLLEFIHRNYECDAQGCWFFQNGPQRVYVAAHTGADANVRTCWLDEHGRLFLDSERGFGVVHSQDMLDASRAIEQGLWSPQDLGFAQMPARFGYVLKPQPVAPHPH